MWWEWWWESMRMMFPCLTEWRGLAHCICCCLRWPVLRFIPIMLQDSSSFCLIDLLVCSLIGSITDFCCLIKRQPVCNSFFALFDRQWEGHIVQSAQNHLCFNVNVSCCSSDKQMILSTKKTISTLICFYHRFIMTV